TFPFDAPGEVTSGADSVTVTSAAPLSLTVSFDGAPGSEHRIRFTGPAPAAPVTVEYVDADGTPLVEPEVITGEIGDQYDARVRRIPGYHPTRMPADKTGRIGAEPITVTLVYASAGHGSGGSWPRSGPCAAGSGEGCRLGRQPSVAGPAAARRRPRPAPRGRMGTLERRRRHG